MKITKTDWINLWNAINPNSAFSDWYMEESSFPDCNESDLPPIFEGDAVLLFQGDNTETYNNTLFKETDVTNGVYFKTIFNRWKKSSSSITFIVSIDKSKSDILKSFVKSINGKIS